MVEDPKPFMFRGPFELTDPGNSFAGQLGVDITITNMGRYYEKKYGWKNLLQISSHYKEPT